MQLKRVETIFDRPANARPFRPRLEDKSQGVLTGITRRSSDREAIEVFVAMTVEPTGHVTVPPSNAAEI